MNAPHVVALNYTVEHGSSVDYQRAAPLSHETPEFQLTLENNSARFELKKHYADERKARKVIEPFIRLWEFRVGLCQGPRLFKLRFQNSEIVDPKPPPPTLHATPGVRNLRATIQVPAATISAKLTVVRANYPSPPTRGAVDLDDPDVVTMYNRYEGYRLKREYLPGMAYFCLTMLTDFLCSSLKEASQKYNISRNVLEKVAKLSSRKGGIEGRKADAVSNDLTKQERRFLEQAIAEIIFRVAEVAANEKQCLPKITLSDLPSLSK